jgi:hypothetical protein
MSAPRVVGWQVFVYAGTYSGAYPREILGRVLFGGQVFATRAEAESAWYDTAPGRNDRATFKRKCEGDRKRTREAKRHRINRKRERAGKKALRGLFFCR